VFTAFPASAFGLRWRNWHFPSHQGAP
jgi:hypothetical protein